MFNERLVNEYIGIIKENPEYYFNDYKNIVERVNNSDAIYKGEPIPVTYQAMLIGEDNMEEFKDIASKLMVITNKITNKYLESPEYRKLFRYPKMLEDLILHYPGYNMPVPICRYDMFYNGKDDYVFCEFNTDGSSSMNEDDIIGEIMLDSKAHEKLSEKYQLKQFELFESWVDKAYEIYKSADQAVDKPNVAILDFTGLGITNEFARFKKTFEDKGFNCEIVDPRDVVYKDGKAYKGDFRLDLVYRRAVTVEMIRRYDEIKDFIEAYLNNAFVMIGSFRSQIMHSKLIFKIFRDPMTKEILTDEENNFLEAHIPFTEILENQEDYDTVLENKDKYILKPFDSYSSDGVYAGQEHNHEEWKEILDKAYQNDYIYQDYFNMDKVDFVEYDKEGKLHITPFSFVMGMYIYAEQFQGLYTRIGNAALISGARDYYTTPNILAIEK